MSDNKSNLDIKELSRILEEIVNNHQDSGTIELEGTCYTIPQEFTLIPELTVWENLFLGRELTCGGFLRKREMRQK